MIKVCSKCQQPKPIEEFWNSCRYKDGKYPSCKDCQRSNNKRWSENNKAHLQEYHRQRCGTPNRIYTRLNHKMKCSLGEFIDWFNLQPQECHYCGVQKHQLPYQCDSQLSRFNLTLSVDRKDNNKGYEIGNMVLACIRCNFIKGDFFSYVEMVEIGEKFVKPKRNKSC
jgi:hypothetical protein